MMIALGADHAGFFLKQAIRLRLEAAGHRVIDYGSCSAESCDYPDFAIAVARDVAAGAVERGILVCATGVGMSIAANKVPGARAALAFNEEEVRLTRAHNDANVLALGARFVGEDEAWRLIEIFLETPFDASARHVRRLEKIAALERQHQEA
ncbi:MAG: ribose 5-phosphate isomerase B [Acidobacteria bacterium]|nr:ribose 5-phosphate isomerase B [Acidobacteriota bacterium]MBI3278309.1 ribose 5-phosphate isomerase B [Acidobacteriota bacterium]